MSLFLPISCTQQKEITIFSASVKSRYTMNHASCRFIPMNKIRNNPFAIHLPSIANNIVFQLIITTIKTP